MAFVFSFDIFIEALVAQLIRSFFLLYTDLRKENARGGIRKPIPQDDEEEENKKDTNGPALVDAEATEEKDNKEQETVIRAPLSQQINVILQNSNISLSQNKNQPLGRKNEDTKAEAQKKMVIRTQTTSLFLQNN